MKTFFYILSVVLFLQSSIDCKAGNTNADSVLLEQSLLDVKNDLHTAKLFKKSSKGKKYKYSLPKIDLTKYPITSPSKPKVKSSNSSIA